MEVLRSAWCKTRIPNDKRMWSSEEHEQGSDEEIEPWWRPRKRQEQERDEGVRRGPDERAWLAERLTRKASEEFAQAQIWVEAASRQQPRRERCRLWRVMSKERSRSRSLAGWGRVVRAARQARAHRRRPIGQSAMRGSCHAASRHGAPPPMCFWALLQSLSP